MLQRVTFAGHAGAVHAPRRPNGVCVVLCPPVGREARSSYRAVAALADRLSAGGASVLRYDHLSTGDSLPLPPDADQLTAWRHGVHEAARFARAHLSAERLVLGGLRLGASLAALEAEALSADAALLLAPVESGRQWLREQQFAAELLRGRPEPARPGDALDLDGLRLSPATAAALNALDLRRRPPVPGPALVATTRPGAAPPAWAPRAKVVAFDGYEALFQEAHASRAPQALFREAAAFVADLTPGDVPAVAQPARAEPPRPELATSEWVEQPVSFGSGVEGVLCLPKRLMAHQGVVIGNTGGDPRAGIGDFAAQACRRLAREGVPALRLDFAGLGESRGRGFETTSHVYEVDRKADFAEAAALLRAQGCRQIVLAGVCSGAHHALHAALASDRYAGVLAINTARLVWRRGDTLATPEPDAAPPRRVRWADLRRPDLWRRVLAGDLRLRPLLKAQAAAVWRAIRAPQDRRARMLSDAVERLSRRGGRIAFLMGRQDPAHRELEACFGWEGQRVGSLPGVEIRVLPDLDHGLFFAASREQALAELVDFVRGFAAVASERARPAEHQIQSAQRFPRAA